MEIRDSTSSADRYNKLGQKETYRGSKKELPS